MKKWNFYTTKEIKPQGWFKRQLEIQAEGLSGNLHKIWPDIRDSAWIGGKCEGWERVPYWLDGFIPLAYLLDDSGDSQAAANLFKSFKNDVLTWKEEDAGQTGAEEYYNEYLKMIDERIEQFSK